MKYLLACLLLVSTGLGHAAPSDYKVGERLASAAAKPGATRTIDWDDLMPKDWDPMKLIESLKLDKLKDSDPRAQEAMDKLKAMWNAAPANTDLNGANVRIAGFAVPLEWNKQEAKEFLLVPYFGACVHVPPPPANQIIHVTTDTPYKVKGYMDAVWVSGKMSVSMVKTAMGDSVYRLKASKIEAYKEPKK